MQPEDKDKQGEKGGIITYIGFRLKEIAEPEWNAHSLVEATGLAYNTVWTIWTGKARRIDLATIAKLCNVLHSEPADLFEVMREVD